MPALTKFSTPKAALTTRCFRHASALALALPAGAALIGGMGMAAPAFALQAPAANSASKTADKGPQSGTLMLYSQDRTSKTPAVRLGSDMANLSLRMQDTLSEIRHQANEAWQGADDLLGEMEKARASLVADVRSQIQTIATDTQKRRQTIMQELEQLESQSLMARDEMEVMLVKFETSLMDLHSRYFHNAESERERLGRYREFLQFMLDEREL